MKTNDLSRSMGKGKTYFKIRTKCSLLSDKLKRRVTIKEFLIVAARNLLADPNSEKFFQKEVKE